MSAGSATIDFLVSVTGASIVLTCLFSSPSCSSFFGARAAVILRSRGGEVGFELLQLVLFAPLLGYDGFKLGYVGFEFGGAFLVLDDYAGDFLQCVDEVHAGSMGVAHGDEAVVVLIFVVALNYKSVLYGLLAVNNCAFRDNADGKAIDFSDALILTVGVGFIASPCR